MKPKSVTLSALAGLSFVTGAVGQYFYPGEELPPSSVWFTALGVLLIFVWYRLDTKQLGYHRSPWLNISVIALALIALPYYFFRSRGAKGGLVATGLFLSAFVASNLLSVAGAYTVYYGLQA